MSDPAAVPYWEQECHVPNRETCSWHCSAEAWVRDARAVLDPMTYREWTQRPDVQARAGAVLAGAR